MNTKKKKEKKAFWNTTQMLHDTISAYPLVGCNQEEYISNK